LVVSRKRSLTFFAINSRRFISEILKKVIKAKNRKIIIAIIRPSSFAQLFERVLKVARAIIIPTAIINI
jgi:hypothetical protein